MKKLIYILMFLLFVISISAQVTQEWVATYNGPGNYEDIGFSTVDGSGNVYVTGISWGSGSERDFATIKYNSAGVQQWVQRYNGTGNHQDEPRWIAVDVSGNVYVTGYTRSGTTDVTEDFCTIKYNTSGVQQWVQIYNGPGNNRDGGASIAVDGAGNVYVTGSSRTGSTAETEGFCTIKYNSSGAQQWVQRYDGPSPGKELGYMIALDNTNNVYVTGWSPGNGSGDDYATIKYNSDGVQQWVQRYNGPGNGRDRTLSLVLDGSANVYITGVSFGTGTSDDFATIKYNSSGVQQWVARYNGPAGLSDIGHSMKVDGFGNVYVAGESATNGTDKDYTVVKYNSSGVQQWVSKYTGPSNFWGMPWLSQIVIDNLGNSYATAWNRGGTTFGLAVIKYNSSGEQQWVQTYYGPMDTAGALSIAIDGSYNLYVSGSSVRAGTDYDFLTIKYSQTIGIQNISSEIPSSYSLSQNYPNPFNPSTFIKFDVLKGSFVSLKIFDALGKEMAILVNEDLKSGTYEVDWNATNYPSGVYFYTMRTEGFTQTKRMMLVK